MTLREEFLNQIENTVFFDAESAAIGLKEKHYITWLEKELIASRDSRKLSAVPSGEYLVNEPWAWEELTTFFSDEQLFKIRYDGETEYEAVITIKRGIAG